MVLAASSTHRFWRAALVAALIPSWFQSGTAEPVTTPPSFPDDNYAPLTTSRPEAPLKADVHVCSGFDEQWDVCPGLPTCFPCSPVDCTFANWGEWFSAGGCTGIRFRQRGVKVSNSECGRPCDGPKIESERHILARCMNSEHDCSFSIRNPHAQTSSESSGLVSYTSFREAVSRLFQQQFQQQAGSS
ncbi:unnamed protein product [Polarella glacialis]|uniref:Uncharacterized protein n=1 Tax=Polarella glacialis TaxID=89957 RepID=A0A813E7A7_POLGL|nr:unnamed protein product [Polarella glacialis]